ncbi:MAG: PF13754 domain-containing protein [Eubacteriales bacterium]|nr:PF13754 domain-containing protein [Eubacteriales bacterium]
MVARVYGNANGQTVIFTHVQGDKWEAIVPFDEDGEYVVELWAEDEAGNIGYACTMLFVISGHAVQGYIVPHGYQGGGTVQDYSGFPTLSEFIGKLGRQMSFAADLKKIEFTTQLEEGGYTIERAVCCRIAD